MNLKKSLTTLAFGLTLASGVLGASQVAPAAHAAASANPAFLGGPVFGPIVRRIRPVISDQSYNCGVTITGKYFTPGAQVKVFLEDAASAKIVYTTATSNGTFSLDLGDDHMGPYIVMSALDTASGTFSNTPNDLAFCLK